ncbi:TIGR03086 family metal-binding protein [Streptomyces sp. Je 1-4]|uniref:TIGR03086 family metal-binding protein n=1 Tax=Streptomyces TaxID=1883 RepID=UPI00140F2750|nr:MULTISPECIES: TIGR03086 family metal-binding protein [unclassified Streptomyces]QIK08205.1 TIGR03086 family protein [Streptomyces sp. ID38640]UYB41833.1 TIGR03086 family metal-binding protein [Streptomyces sp. Je 1-4]UZQ38099.1 TIGR03086 family metal-binding protein [Streptomyces sp. Je 1-4] [Streptomyces sp. Je 1-4 4N24]UZQ45516.1 TIGR03086 family metal-binding protein [Streptomyces sp. Je 1-4] [Streptomyces sp. Je 1-4 4N24_ara]
MTETIDFAAQARLVSQLAARTAEEQLDAPTPCEAYAVRHLLGHLVGLAAAFQEAARKDLGPMTSVDPGATEPDVEPGWRTELDRNLQGMAEAWLAPEAWEGETQAGGVTLPAAIAGRIALNELVLHGWDLARATGQEYAPDAASLGVSYALLMQFAESPERGPFGPPVEVAADAPLLDQVVALSGRRPDWTPPTS